MVHKAIQESVKVVVSVFATDTKEIKRRLLVVRFVERQAAFLLQVEIYILLLNKLITYIYKDVKNYLVNAN